MIILDTNVVSEPLKPQPEPAVLQWLDAQKPPTPSLSTISCAEFLAGIDRLPAGRRRAAPDQALAEQIAPLFEDRILALDTQAALPFAQIHIRAQLQATPSALQMQRLRPLHQRTVSCRLHAM